MEAALVVRLNKRELETVKGIDLAELCITSSAEIHENISNDINVKTIKAKGNKCPVCWKISQKNCERHG